MSRTSSPVDCARAIDMLLCCHSHSAEIAFPATHVIHHPLSAFRFGPKPETQCAFGQPQDVPKGMLYRGHYTVHSEFVDDDKNCHLAWDWCVRSFVFL